MAQSGKRRPSRLVARFRADVPCAQVCDLYRTAPRSDAVAVHVLRGRPRLGWTVFGTREFGTEKRSRRADSNCQPAVDEDA